MKQLLLAIYELPLPLSAVLIVTPVIAASVAGTLLFRRWSADRWSASRDAIGVCVSAVGVIYAVLLAMIAVAAWEHYSELEADVAREASLAGSLFRDATGLSSGDATRVQLLARQYVGGVYCEEFPRLRTGTLDPDAAPSGRVIDDLITTVLAIKPRDLGEANVHESILEVIDGLVVVQRSRLLAADAQLLGVLWAVVLLGGLITLTLTWLTIVEDVRLNLLLNVAYATMVGLIVFSIFALDRPFWGGVSVDDRPLASAAASMERRSRVLEVADCLSAPPGVPGE